MRKFWALVVLLCITWGAQAQLLWKVSGNGIKEPSYVIGTHHLAPITILNEIEGWKAALESVDQVYGELVFDDMMEPENMARMQQASLMPVGKTLSSLYTAEEYAEMGKIVKELIGMDIRMLDGAKPAFVSTQVALVVAMKTIEGFNPQVQLDGWIQHEGKRLGKAIGGMETVAFQADMLFGTQSLERQAEQLYYTLTHLERTEDQAKRLTAAYMAQDIEAMGAIMDEKTGNAGDPLPEEEDALIYNRNAQWAKELPQLMSEHATLLAVGAGHLPGERGLLQLLRNAGYTIEAVR